jgi:addiction module RelB/DinJ family antitoxin
MIRAILTFISTFCLLSEKSIIFAFKNNHISYKNHTTMAAVLIQTRVDATLKAQSEEVLNKLGLDFTSAIRAYLNKIVQTQSIPFSLSLAQEGDYYTTPEEDAYDYECAEKAYAEYIKSGKKSRPMEDLYKEYGIV